MENVKGELIVRREVKFVYGFQAELDRLYGWGLQWGRGYKTKAGALTPSGRPAPPARGLSELRALRAAARSSGRGVRRRRWRAADSRSAGWGPAAAGSRTGRRGRAPGRLRVAVGRLGALGLVGCG